MRALLDVNVLIALMDPDHLFHEKAHDWWGEHQEDGWASCSITENGVVRILSNPKYSPERPFSCKEILDRLSAFAEESNHTLIPDELRLRDTSVFQIDLHIRSAQLTDIYLLGLAVNHHLRLVTFDQGISLHTVHQATPDHLWVLKG